MDSTTAKIVIACVTSLLLSACVGGERIESADTANTSQVSSCTPGETNACVCADGDQGRQTCDSDGTWSDCECVGDEDAGDQTDTGVDSGMTVEDEDTGTDRTDTADRDTGRDDANDTTEEDTSEDDARSPEEYCESYDPDEEADLGGGGGNENYDVIDVAAGDTYTKQLSDGETWGNVLIDVSASGASYRINAIADNFTVKNVGVRGELDRGHREPFVTAVNSSGATGRIENVYLGDPTTAGGTTGIFVMKYHAGDLTVDGVNLQHFGDNGLYGSAPGFPDGGHGKVVVKNSYASNNEISGFRLGSDGSYIENSVSYGNAHRGYWGFSGNTEAIDCHFGDNGSADVAIADSLNPSTSGTVIQMTNSRWDTEIAHKHGDTANINGSSQGTPQDTVPAGAPSSAKEAASGGGGSSSSTDASVLAFITKAGASETGYEFTTCGPTEFTRADYNSPSGQTIEGGPASGNDSIEQTNGFWRADGSTGNGYGDAYLVSGPIATVDVDDPDNMWIELDGDKVTPEELVNRTSSN